MSDIKVICPSCKEEHSEDRNRKIIKFGKYWIEVASSCGWDLLCGHCEFGLNERDYNGAE